MTYLAQKNGKENSVTHSQRLWEELASSEERMEQVHLDWKVHLLQLGGRYVTAYTVNCIFLALC